jgi:hypothetical protein
MFLTVPNYWLFRYRSCQDSIHNQKWYQGNDIRKTKVIEPLRPLNETKPNYQQA